VHLVVTEVEKPLQTEAKLDLPEEGEKKKKGKGPSSIKLAPRQAKSDSEEKSDDPFLLHDSLIELPEALETRRVETGLGQVYQSPPIDLNKFPPEMLCLDLSRPRDVPIAVRLEADVEPGEQQSIQYTYISLQYAAPASPVTDKDGIPAPPVRGQWSASVYSQKLQYGIQCFVLHEVFGVCSKIAPDTEVEGGNSDCVICLSEPRDTAVLPCRHMCFCSYCAGIVRLQCDRCPVCRQKVQSLLQFKREQDPVSNDQVVGAPYAASASASASIAVPGSSNVPLVTAAA
jgi:hypothetical protein